MTSMKWICLASGISAGLGLLYYRYSKRLGSNSDRNRKNIKIVETFKPQLPPPSQPTQTPPPPPPPQQQQQQLPSLLQQQEQLPSPLQHKVTAPHVANCVTIQRQLNGRNFYFVQPKSPLMVFCELFNYVQIHSQEHQVDAEHTVKSYTATIEIDDEIFIGNDISETLAKQKACANFLRVMLEKQLTGQSAGPSQEEFPWINFASLAMDYLLHRWKLHPTFSMANYVQEESQSNTGKKINDNARMNNARMSRLICRKTPLAVLHEWFVRVPIHVQQNLHDSYTATIEIDDAIYFGTDISKTQCKQHACENFLRSTLANKLNERSAEHASTSKFKGPLEKKFPWVYFASIGMHFLINQWELQY